MLCDAPGFDDTEGVESDIISGYGVVKVLKTAKSLRIFALQNKLDFGARGDGLRKLARILSYLIQDLDIEKMDSILFGFTKFNEEDDLQTMVYDVCEQDLSSEDEAFKLVVEALKEIAADPLRIDPLDVREGNES